MKAISEDLQPLLSVAAAVLDASGRLLEANAGFVHMLGPGTGLAIGANVESCFDLPGYRELAASQPRANGDVYRGTLRFRKPTGEGANYRGKVWRSAFGLCVVAEVEVGGPVHARRVSDSDARVAPRGPAQAPDASLVDKLTGAGTRARFDQAVGSEIAAAKAGGLPLCVLVSGPDRFGQVVAANGEEGANRVLARFGYLLRLLTRPSDITARLDSSEFAVLLPNTNLAQAMSAAERIRTAVAADAYEPAFKAVTASFAVAQLGAGEGAAAFLARSVALFRQAQASGNRTVTAPA